MAWREIADTLSPETMTIHFMTYIHVWVTEHRYFMCEYLRTCIRAFIILDVICIHCKSIAIYTFSDESMLPISVHLTCTIPPLNMHMQVFRKVKLWLIHLFIQMVCSNQSITVKHLCGNFKHWYVACTWQCIAITLKSTQSYHNGDFLSGFVVTTHSSVCKQCVKFLTTSGFDFLFVRALLHCDNKPLQIQF